MSKKRIVHLDPMILSSSEYGFSEIYEEYVTPDDPADIRTMICTHCAGLENVDMSKPGSLRCRTCGGTLKEIKDEPPPAPKEDEYEREKPKYWWQKIFRKELR